MAAEMYLDLAVNSFGVQECSEHGDNTNQTFE